MDLKKNYHLFIISLITIACGTDTQNANNKTQIYKGDVIIGHEVSTFKIIGDTLTYWLLDSNDILNNAYNKIIGDNAEPYTAIYAALSGTILPKEKEGLAADYDGVFQLQNIIAVEEKKDSMYKIGNTMLQIKGKIIGQNRTKIPLPLSTTGNYLIDMKCNNSSLVFLIQNAKGETIVPKSSPVWAGKLEADNYTIIIGFEHNNAKQHKPQATYNMTVQKH